MAVKKRAKKLTLGEFRAWLDGVEELQPADWAPDKNQWKLIRDKIDNIVKEVKEVEIVREVQTQAPMVESPQRMVAPQQQFVPPQAPAQPSAFDNSALLDVPPPAMTPAAQAALSGKLPSEMIPGSDGKTHTPTIDTSDGTYESSFSG